MWALTSRRASSAAWRRVVKLPGVSPDASMHTTVRQRTPEQLDESEVLAVAAVGDVHVVVVGVEVADDLLEQVRQAHPREAHARRRAGMYRGFGHHVPRRRLNRASSEFVEPLSNRPIAGATAAPDTLIAADNVPSAWRPCVDRAPASTARSARCTPWSSPAERRSPTS